jgi:hypothetical protein
MRGIQISLCGFLLLSLVGCVTNEWTQTNGECWAEAYAAIPEKNETRVVTRSKLVERPDGTTTCTTRNVAAGGTVGRPIYEAITECKQGTKLVRQEFNETVSVDLNQTSRSNYAHSCRVNLCVRRYGNADCKLGK